MKFKNLVFSILSIILGLIFGIFLLEIILFALPVTDSTNNLPVNHKDPYIHFNPNQTFTYSKGWNFSILTKKKANNYGFMNDFDFNKNDDKPLLAIIGDSYVEAMQVPNKESHPGILAEKVKDWGRVYGIGYAGSALSQYLAFAQFSANEFAPSSMVFVIIGNDFDESLLEYRSDPGFHYFKKTEIDSELIRVDFNGHGFLRSLAKKTNLMRYLFLTCGIDWRKIAALWGSEEVKQKKYVGNVEAQVSEKKIQDSKIAVDLFFKHLPVYSKLPNDKILFVVDGMRLYDENNLEISQKSYFGKMRDYFIFKANILGYEVIDMETVFSNHYKENQKRFEFPIDGHWNSLGHKLVAEEILKSKMFYNFSSLKK